MSLREFAPFFQWGFSLRRSKFLVPLLNSDVFVWSNEAVSSHMALDPAAPPLKRTPSSKTSLTDLLAAAEAHRELPAKASTLSSSSSSAAATTLHSAAVNTSPSLLLLHDTAPTTTTTAAAATVERASALLDASRPCAAAAAAAAAAHDTPSSANTASSQQRSDDDLIAAVLSGEVPGYSLEKVLGDCTRAVRIRRAAVALQLRNGRGTTSVLSSAPASGGGLPLPHSSSSSSSSPLLSTLPFEHFDYTATHGACIENCVGYVPLPVGVAGPLLLDGQVYQVPMATTEGCLVASTARGAKAITESGGATSALLGDGMTRGPCVRLPSLARAAELAHWLSQADNYALLEREFASTSRFARLSSIKAAVAGHNVYLRFRSSTGDAMGMNMLSKGVERCLAVLRERFADLDVVAVSGNYCSDKKAAAINWIEGRGKSVVCEAVVRGDIVERVLKTSVERLCALNIHKNLVGSAMAGALGGFNAHAANIVAAVFLATGQDPAQVVESASCLTLMEPCNDGRDLCISVTMPSIEVGTVGGGTHLPAQSACLDILGVRGSSAERPGANAQQLARIVAAAVLAGELSLMSALAAGQLTQSHLRLNRSSNNLTAHDSGTTATAAAVVSAPKSAL